MKQNIKLSCFTPSTRFLATVLGRDLSPITKEEGPEIFVQSHYITFPSESLEAEPSNEMLSAGKVITWSGPATAMGGLFPLQPSQECSFLQGINIPVAVIIITANKNIFFIAKGFKTASLF